MKAPTASGDALTAVSARAETSGSRLRRAMASFLFAVLSAVVVNPAGAYAYWTAMGLGSSTETTGTMQPVVVSALTGGDDPASTLIPGGTADVVLRVTNPNPVGVQIFSVQSNGAAFAAAGFEDCTTTGVTFTPPSSPLAPTVIVDAGSSLLLTLPGAAGMDNTSSSGCQGAQFHIPVTLAARQ